MRATSRRWIKRGFLAGVAVGLVVSLSWWGVAIVASVVWLLVWNKLTERAVMRDVGAVRYMLPNLIGPNPQIKGRHLRHRLEHAGVLLSARRFRAVMSYLEDDGVVVGQRAETENGIVTRYYTLVA